MTTAPAQHHPGDLSIARRGPAWFHRNGLVRVTTECKPMLGDDYRKLAVVVAFSFVMGFLEAFLVLLVVQMAVALAGERTIFDVRLGPVAVEDVSMLTGVSVGVVIIVLLVVCLVPVARLAGYLAAGAQRRTRARLLSSYLGASWQVRSLYPEGHLQELLTTYSTRAERAVNQLVIAAVAMCGLSAILLVAFTTSPIIAGVTVLCVAGVGSLLRPVMTLTRDASTTYAESDRIFAGRMAEVARMTPEITAFDVAATVETEVNAQATEVASSLQRIRTLMRLGSSLYQYLALLLVVLAIGAVSVLADGGGLATTGTVLLLLVRALAYGQQLQSQIQSSHETAPFLERMEREIQSLRAAKVERDGVRIDAPAPLRFEEVWFAYDPSQDVLRGISLEIEPGEAIGVVGRSGAGKSTLVQLLLRLRTPTRGTLSAAGVELGSVSLERWYELVAYVPQDNKLITGTVADNIRFFRPDLSDATVEEAARRAHLHDELIALPHGYDTVIGQGVRDLSGGQRQRLGIARALAGSPGLIILDEPTSALDARSERLITRTLADLHGQVTIVIIAHRPKTTAICDRIFRIHDGEVDIVPPATAGDDPHLLTSPD